MKSGKRRTIIMAAGLTLIAPVLLSVPTLAGTPAATSLIDKDFEVALRKFVSKRFFNRIDASDEQREKLSKIMADTQDETRPAREELRRSLLDLNDMMADSKTSDEAIKNKVKELREKREKLQDRRLSALLEARKVLTDEQKEQIRERINGLITGGAKPRRLGMLFKSAALENLIGEQ